MTTLVSDLSKAQYEAIGKVACEWSHLEFTLRFLIEKISGLDEIKALAVTTELRSTSLLNLIFALLHDRHKPKNKQSPLHQHLKAVEQTLLKCRGERNTVVHLDWLRESGKAIGIKTDAKGKLSIVKRSMSAKDMETVAKSIASLNNVIWQHWTDFETGRLRPLRTTLPSPHLKRRNPPRDKRQGR